MKLRHRGPRTHPSGGGFSLVELLVVVVVLAVLASIVVFSVRGVRNDADDAAQRADANVLRSAQEAFHAQHGRYATEPELVSSGMLASQSVTHDIELDGNGYRLVESAPPGGGGGPGAPGPATTAAAPSGPGTTAGTQGGGGTSVAPGTSAATATTIAPAASIAPGTSAAPTSVPAAPGTTVAGSLAGVSCAVTVYEAWGSGGNANLTITNLSGVNLATWTVRISPNGYGVNLWNATTSSSTSSAVIATNLAWNGGVANAATATPTGGSITGQGITNGLTLPCTVLPNTVSAANVTCAFRIVDAWGSGGNGTLSITNTNSVALSSWTVAITRNGATIALWGADATSTPTVLTASNRAHNAYVASGATATPTGGSVSGSGITVGQTFPCAVTAAS